MYPLFVWRLHLGLLSEGFLRTFVPFFLRSGFDQGIFVTCLSALDFGLCAFSFDL